MDSEKTTDKKIVSREDSTRKKAFSLGDIIEKDPEEIKDPEHLGCFKIKKRLGFGGYGIVYEARADPVKMREIAEKPLSDIDRMIEDSLKDADHDTRDDIKIKIAENTVDEFPAVFDREDQKKAIFSSYYQFSEDKWGFFRKNFTDSAVASMDTELAELAVHPEKEGEPAQEYKDVAIKTLLSDLVFSDAAENLISEAKVMKTASDMTEHVVRVYGYKTRDTQKPFYIMELCDGTVDPEKISPEESLESVLQAAKGLKTLHDHSIFHRDIKPENIMWTDKDGKRTYKLTDFGLAKQKTQKTMSMGTIKGTPNYMSPEQAAGDNHMIDETTDTYSLTASLFCMLTGIPPFPKRFEAKNTIYSKAASWIRRKLGKKRKTIQVTKDAEELMGSDQISELQKVTLAEVQAMDTFLEDHPRELNPDISKDIENLIIKGVQKYKEDRYTDDELIEDLELIVAGKRPKHAGRNWGYRFKRWAAKNKSRWQTVKTAMMGAGLAAGLAFGSLRYYQHTQTIGYLVKNTQLQGATAEEKDRFYDTLAQKVVERKVSRTLDEIIRRIGENEKSSDSLEGKYKDAIPINLKKGEKDWSYFMPYNSIPGIPIRQALISYEITGDVEYLKQAKQISECLEMIINIPDSRGYGVSFLAAAELGMQINDERYINMAKTAARNLLEERYNEEKGIIIPCNLARVGEYEREDVSDIIETARELPLLFWAYKNSEGEEKERYGSAAKSVLKTIEEKMIRKGDWWKKRNLENSIFPRIVLDDEGNVSAAAPGYESAGFKDKQTILTADIARYHANAMRLFTEAGNVFGDDHYTEIAKDLSDFYIEQLDRSENYVPYFDLVNRNVAGEDTIAGNIGALALYFLSEKTSEEDSKKYRDASERLFRAISDNFIVTDETNKGLIKGAIPNIVNADYQSLMENDLNYLQLLSKLSKER